MKVVASDRPRSANILGVRKDSRRCIMKAASTIEHAGLSEEMNDCLLQLSGMVPHVPRNEKGNIEAAVLIQYVIDYITDLSQQLGSQNPFVNSPLSCATLSSLSPSSRHNSELREPLSEKSIENIVSCVSCTPPSTSPSHPLTSSTELDIRPPSK